jgi:hypothetical protein
LYVSEDPTSICPKSVSFKRFDDTTLWWNETSWFVKALSVEIFLSILNFDMSRLVSKKCNHRKTHSEKKSTLNTVALKINQTIAVTDRTMSG